jgi:hypothetical protein
LDREWIDAKGAVGDVPAVAGGGDDVDEEARAGDGRGTSRRGVRIEGLVPDLGDRERIRAAAQAAGLPAAQFIGAAALAAAQGSGFETARVQHLLAVQRDLTEQLQALREGQSSVGGLGRQSVDGHAHTHERLDEAVECLRTMLERIGEAVAGQVATREKLERTLAAHLDTHERLVALLAPVEEARRAATSGLRLLTNLDERVQANAEALAKLARHAGLVPGEPAAGNAACKKFR